MMKQKQHPDITDGDVKMYHQTQQQTLHYQEILLLQPNPNNDCIDHQYHRQPQQQPQQQQQQRSRRSLQKILPSDLWFQIIEYLIDHTNSNSNSNSNNTNTCFNSNRNRSYVSRRYRSNYTKRKHHYDQTNRSHNRIDNAFYGLISLSETNYYFNRLCSIYIQRYWKLSKPSIIESSSSSSSTEITSESWHATYQQVNDPYYAYNGIIQRLYHVDYKLAQQFEQQYICCNDDNHNSCHNNHDNNSRNHFPCSWSTSKYRSMISRLALSNFISTSSSKPVMQYYNQLRANVIKPLLCLLPNHLIKWLQRRQHKYVSLMNRYLFVILLLIVVALLDLFDSNKSSSFTADIMKPLLTIVMVRRLYMKGVVIYFVRRTKRYASITSSSSSSSLLLLFNTQPVRQPLHSEVYEDDNRSNSKTNDYDEDYDSTIGRTTKEELVSDSVLRQIKKFDDDGEVVVVHHNTIELKHDDSDSVIVDITSDRWNEHDRFCCSYPTMNDTMNESHQHDFMSEQRISNHNTNSRCYNDVNCIDASSNASSSDSKSVVMYSHRRTVDHDFQRNHCLHQENDYRRQAHGWVGMYHRAIQLAKKRIIHFVQEERFNAYKALNGLERDTLSSSFINACSSDSTLHIVQSLAKSLPTQDFFIGDDGAESCALHTAAFYGSAQVIDFLCRNIDTSYYNNSDIATKLNMATRTIQYNDGGLCDVNVTDMNGWTALHYAVGANSVEAIRTLIKCGASYNISAINGYTPYQWAVRLGHYAVADELHAIMIKDKNQHNLEEQQNETDQWWTFLGEVMGKFY